MNFLLFFFIVFSNCIPRTHTITYRTNKNYEVLQNLIPNTCGKDLFRLFDEIRNKLNFSCTFTLDNYIDNKEITISQLNNKDTRTGYCIIPRLLCEITCIKRLIISTLWLATLPTEFRNLTELDYLDLSNNEFETIPESLFSLTKLKVLHFNNNKINAIAPGIIRLKGLKTLCIGGCTNLKSVNNNLFKLKNLKELNLSENILLFSTKNSVEYTTTTFEKNDNNLLIEDYKYLKTLIISHSDLDRIPSFFTNFINLEELDISQNTFNKVPEEIHLFSSLKILNISKNYITEIIIGNDLFSNLLILDLSYNEITKVSISISSLQRLETLNLNS
ncbi:Leucine rich repeat protein, partial [Spraguea lophii 42_110]